MSSLFTQVSPKQSEYPMTCSKAQSSVEDIKDTKNAPFLRDCLHGLGQKLHGRNPLRIYSHPEASRNQGLRVKSQWRRLAQEFDTRNRTSYLQGYTILSWWKSPCPFCFFEEISWWSVCVFRVSYTYKNSRHFFVIKADLQLQQLPRAMKNNCKNLPISSTCLKLKSLQLPIVHSHGTQKLDQTCLGESPAIIHRHYQHHPTYGSHPEWPKSRLTTR